MKEIDMNIDVSDVKNDGKSGCEIFINTIESGIISSYYSESNKPIDEANRRKVYKLMTRLEDHKDGIISLNDENFSFMQERWKNKKLPLNTLASEFRKVFMRIDKIILPDEFSEYEDKSD